MTAVKATALVVLAAAEETWSRAIMAKLQYDFIIMGQTLVCPMMMYFTRGCIRA